MNASEYTITFLLLLSTQCLKYCEIVCYLGFGSFTEVSLVDSSFAELAVSAGSFVLSAHDLP